MLKKILGLAAVVLFATAATAAAQAAPPSYNGRPSSVTVSDGVVEPGQTVKTSAQIFTPGATVTFTFFSAPINLGTAVADANGVATLEFKVPTGVEAGTHRIEASGLGANGQPLTVTTTIQVAAAGAGASGLPTTGSSNSGSLTQVAVGVMVFGGLMVVMANKRRTAAQRDTAGV
jgi:hypothetical protein